MSGIISAVDLGAVYTFLFGLLYNPGLGINFTGYRLIHFEHILETSY